MKVKNKYLASFREGVMVAFPIVIGYFPIAIAFGLMAKNTFLSLRDTSLLSILVYAGASQFMALDLIGTGAGAGSIILATFLLNLRHLIMSASLAVELKEVPDKLLPLLGFGITDETFSVLSFNREKLSPFFVLVVNFLSYISWVVGTIVGFVAGEILPMSLQSSLGIGLYAMFAGLLFPEIKKSKDVLYLSLISIVVYTGLFYLNIFSAGWDIVLGIIISSFLGVIFLSGENGVEEN